MSAGGFDPTQGWCAREVEEDLPDVGLLQVGVELPRKLGPLAESPRQVRERLRELSNRFRGSLAVSIRREPVPAAYRLFFRQIGLDPDVVRTPIEAAVLERMLRGGFLSGGLLRDVLLIALIDTCVPVWALDADYVDGPLGIRPCREGERLGRAAGAVALPTGRLVIADASTPLAVLFGALGDRHGPDAGTRRLTLFSVGVPGVPAMYVEEALWSCHSALAGL